MMNFTGKTKARIFLSLILLCQWPHLSFSLETCPILEENETSLDCPWAGMTRGLDKFNSTTEILNYLKSSGSGKTLLEDLQEDAKNPKFFELWGQTINFDELAKGEIVKPNVINALTDIAGVESPKEFLSNRSHVNAGVAHTYGYLFSNLKTPFGYKRARWVEPDIEKGLGLSPGTLGPNPKTGSLFGNVTALLTKFAYFGDGLDTPSLLLKSKQVSSELLALDPSTFQITRLEESVTTIVPFSIRTDLIDFKNQTGTSKNSVLLVYSIHWPKTKTTLVYTGFPVEKSFAEKALSPQNLGSDKPIKVRYNAWISESPPSFEHKGNRTSKVFSKK